MTVIAFDGKFIAADRQLTTENQIDGFAKKIEVWSKGVWASSGRVDDGILFREWLEDRRKKPKLHKSFHGLFTEDGQVYEIYDTLVPMPALPGIALGDGGPAASMLMREGYSAEEACETVIRHNIYCGGPVDVVKVRD